MRILGALLAGGLSTRFGSDKAAALLDDKPLLDHVADALRPQVDALLLVGRAQPGFNHVPDSPRPGLGPLGGLLAALEAATARGFDAVLSAPCDMPRLPAGLAARLAPAPAFVAEQPVLGLWRAADAPLLSSLLVQDRRAVRAFAEACRARPVSIPGLANVNAAGDLCRLQEERG